MVSKEIDNYIKRLPDEAQTNLQTIRGLVRKAVPGGDEVISYGIPTMKQDGKYVIYFAGYKDHVSIHPIPPGTAAFQKLIKPYVAGKGTLKFPLDKPLPLSLIREVIKLSIKHHQERTK